MLESSNFRLSCLCNFRTIFDDDSLGAHILLLENQLIHHIFIFSFLHRGGYRDNISHLDIYFLEMIVSGDMINLPYIMVHYINITFKVENPIYPMEML